MPRVTLLGHNRGENGVLFRQCRNLGAMDKIGVAFNTNYKKIAFSQLKADLFEAIAESINIVGAGVFNRRA
ncbi:MAG: hypothetical protein ACI9PU_002731 [Ascidiaceihabitans sp.]|jgi:hypothetical protein